MPSEGPFSGRDYTPPPLSQQIEMLEREKERLRGENENLHRIRKELLEENEKLKKLLAEKILKDKE